MFAALFWIALFLLAYSHFLYPAVLALIAPRERAGTPPGFDNKWPPISMILAAHNEEHVIENKILNFLESSYSGSSEFVIVNDGSADRTADLANKHASERIRVFTQTVRGGKGAAVNRGIKEARGEILVFTDANAFFEKTAIAELVRPFADPKTGLVTGATRYTSGTIGSIYQRYEQMLKVLESRLGVVATADGAIYAMRKSLFREYDPSLINDFMHPMLVSLQNAGAVIAPDAICVEDYSVENEFARQVRMVSQAALVLITFLPQLIRAGRWRSILVLVSHKLLRWLTAPILAVLVIATLATAHLNGIYLLALWGEIAFAILVAGGALASRFGVDQRILSFAYQFVALNVAGAVGLWRCLAGRVPVVWQPRNN